MHQETIDRLAFFGRMNAHISHEIKNILATISETSGLLLDIMDIAGVEKLERGGRMIELCERVAGLVDRGNATVRNMNRFAHSVDEPVRETDLADLLGLMASLAAYMPYNRKVELVLPESGLSLRTRPFLLMNLVYNILAKTFPLLNMEDRVELEAEPRGDGVLIRVTPASAKGPVPDAELPEGAADLCQTLSATLTAEGKSYALALEPCSPE